MYLRKKRRPVAEINVVPYIDVMLVLLIIFMATAPLITHGVKVDLPKMSESDLVETKEAPPIIASIDAEGRYYVSVGTDPEAPMDAVEVAAVIKLKLQQNPETPVLIKGSGRVSYQEVLLLMDFLKNAGVPSVGLMTKSFEE
ncbi:protein TolR [Pseudoalteromonas sp. SS15]|jgi:biopolymer transport protein TolR|uniref:Tol-Pal system protein TolR n=1 Tax=Pseudoalteromonas phenolica TaxID=161398 RepID=A0A0S2K2X3_9GAMM|nr:protein TolR [Pseudoalteromonas phenolica]ALO42420.1 Tol protein [Pseudoalteromonas phenolica]MBE0356483.1 biopolymer transport protein TolR [Pseudoalteromonas phenolica O-BC30]RXE93814.1 protein TolR [Pseudoalteromonas phenolica O-BC30]TLX46558.1 protein TolR [Pseudoalteromonas phenolica]TMO53400.1 protein TolR [Pseudoalteromonas phenolica]|tara:strand:+ start:1299 stop:1724 length:426 start_codon:yes stop_codon:yes gene_type:complete